MFHSLFRYGTWGWADTCNSQNIWLAVQCLCITAQKKPSNFADCMAIGEGVSIKTNYTAWIPIRGATPWAQWLRTIFCVPHFHKTKNIWPTKPPLYNAIPKYFPVGGIPPHSPHATRLGQVCMMSMGNTQWYFSPMTKRIHIAASRGRIPATITCNKHATRGCYVLQLEVNMDGISNALTSVGKDNLALLTYD